MLRPLQSIGVITAVALVAAAGSVSPAANNAQESKPPVKVMVSHTKASPTLRQVNRGTFEVIVAVENTGNADLVLWPFLSVQVLDPKGRPLAKSENIGRWGDLDSPSILEAIPFVNLQPGKAHEIRLQLNRYLDDADSGFAGWQLPGSGDYRLILHYKFDRAAAKKSYGAGCKTIDDPDRPWNRAIEIDNIEKVKLAVKP